jgi:hypothetical protein
MKKPVIYQCQLCHKFTFTPEQHVKTIHNLCNLGSSFSNLFINVSNYPLTEKAKQQVKNKGK